MRRSVLGQVLQIREVLGAALRLLHRTESGERTDLHRYPKELAFNGVTQELRIAGHAQRALHNVEAAEARRRRHVASTPEHAGVGGWVESPVLDGRKRRFELVKSARQAPQVLRVGIGDDVEILGASDIAVRADGHTADNDEIDAALMEGVEQGAKVELAQCPLAAPLIALSCLQRAWTRASRSLIGTFRSASILRARAFANSSLLPLSASVVIVGMLALPAAAEAGFGVSGFQAEPLAEGGAAATEAGSHPVSLELAVGLEGAGEPGGGDLRDLSIELPPGLLENPTAVPTCSQADFLTPRSSPWEESLSGESCPDDTQVGTIAISSSYGGGETRTFGLFNLAPPPGAPSELAADAYGVPLIFVPQVRQADGDYGFTLLARNLSQMLSITALRLSIWGTPWALLHDDQRGDCLNEAEPSFGWAKCSVGRPAHLEGSLQAYLTLPTSCDAPLAFVARASSWQGDDSEAAAQVPALTRCDSLAFEPQAGAALINPRASSPSGYRFTIDVDTSGVTAPTRRAPAPVRKAVVQLPEGVTVNPAVGAGLGVCTPAQYAAETPTSPPGAGCPNQSKIGDFTVKSPLVAGGLDGSIFLAAPFQNPFGGLLAVYLVAKNEQRGLLVKVAGELSADAATGRLTTTFDRLPRIPYSQLVISFREGQRSPLATPPACGRYSTETELTSWADATVTRGFSLPLQVSAGTGGGPCPQGAPPFQPGVAGGSLNSRAGAYAPFYLHLTRNDGEAEITSYSATFPPGLLGKLAGVPLCSDAAIAAAANASGVEERDHPSCPAASRIGRTYSGYGVGPVLNYAPGGLYLAGPYRGAQFSVVAVDSALVGPFDLGTIVVRSAIRIDAATAQARIDTSGSDPIPHILDGIPIHLRDVRIYIDRPEFTVNPTTCNPEQISSTLTGSAAALGLGGGEASAASSARYQAFDCGSLGFRPRISMRMQGPIHRAQRPSLRVVVRPRAGDADIGAATVVLPETIFLNQGHLRGVCRRPELAADRCPSDSAYGEGVAYTPLLDKPLRGKAYLVASDNVLPDLVFALRGEGFAVNLAGRIDAAPGGRLRVTYATVPDAPVSRFVARMYGGRLGVLENGENLCAPVRAATARFLGHANRGWIARPLLQASCGGRHRNRQSKGGNR